MIARSIKCMIASADAYIGHPFVITTLCDRLQVPVEDDDDISSPLDSLGQIFFQRAQRDLQEAQAAAEAAAAAPRSPPPQHPQHQQHQHYMMDWGLTHFSPPLMAAVQDYRAQVPTPSYYQ
ncbi:hypothetical protein A2U01_0039032 [Trifolium medium]|uniref:Uncharacterized protein n=1 Tax=Trifolium medium TaxID=97028 RepID=A0A392Q0L3_9FABA|nr:hypothetical protein [Trifolium medium]